MYTKVSYYFRKLILQLIRWEQGYNACELLVLPDDIVFCIQEQFTKIHIPNYERTLWKLMFHLSRSSLNTRKRTLTCLFVVLCKFPFFLSVHRHIHKQLYIQMDKKLEELCVCISNKIVRAIIDRWILIGSKHRVVFSGVVPLF